ncbi:hypothetical protein FGADI_4793 [Fusarium gaditjirri]|uniref:Uncharacterized protein n=1 Tax=Fusarium gaditjirri TaxID=282569 RepID=A0A8H4TCB5_9HYPO|nr:hypothetical protein FGADI_4793 [Fusarium gaditjirri]
MHFAPSYAYHARSGPDPALALHRHLFLKPLDDALNLTPRQRLFARHPWDFSHPPSLPSSVLLHTPGHVVAELSTTDFTYTSRPLIPFSDLPLQPYLALGPSLFSRLARGHCSLNPADLFLNKNKKDNNAACSLIFTFHSTPFQYYMLASCSKPSVSPTRRQTQQAVALEQLQTP